MCLGQGKEPFVPPRLSLEWQSDTGNKPAHEIIGKELLSKLNSIITEIAVEDWKQIQLEKERERLQEEQKQRDIAAGLRQDDGRAKEVQIFVLEELPPEAPIVHSLFELLMADWHRIVAHELFEPSLLDGINRNIAVYGLSCGPDVLWEPDRILTLKMQDLLECHLGEIGIPVKVAETLEENADISCLRDLLSIKWSDLERYTLSEAEGGIKNFGEKSLLEIRECLKRAGFHGSGKWVKEQNTPQFRAKMASGEIVKWPMAPAVIS